jgi:hypothetical protein
MGIKADVFNMSLKFPRENGQFRNWKKNSCFTDMKCHLKQWTGHAPQMITRHKLTNRLAERKKESYA